MEAEMKLLRCRELGFDCDGEIRAEDGGEILRQAAEHAQSVHHVTITPEMAEQARQLIREE
jgi:predicted small metal-binding protein